MSRSTASILRDYGITALVAIGLALGIRAFILEAYRIPSSSMSPTLLAGDTIFVAKWPITLTRSYSPQRGEVIIYSDLPDANAFTLDYIKRVIALPGDTVAIVDGKIHLNGNLVTSDSEEKLPDHPGYSVQIKPPLLDRFGPEKVPPSSVFVIGDLRSKDNRRKRSWGIIPIAAIKGRALWTWLSIDPTHHQIRWDRMFKAVH